VTYALWPERIPYGAVPSRGGEVARAEIEAQTRNVVAWRHRSCSQHVPVHDHPLGHNVKHEDCESPAQVASGGSVYKTAVTLASAKKPGRHQAAIF
jgi:hypothetical protein